MNLIFPSISQPQKSSRLAPMVMYFLTLKQLQIWHQSSFIDTLNWDLSCLRLVRSLCLICPKLQIYIPVVAHFVAHIIVLKSSNLFILWFALSHSLISISLRLALFNYGSNCLIGSNLYSGSHSYSGLYYYIVACILTMARYIHNGLHGSQNILVACICVLWL